MSGISEFLVEGVVAYSNKVKVNVLGVDEELLIKHGRGQFRGSVRYGLRYTKTRGNGYWNRELQG